jgi:hypothetical protein
MVSDRDRTYTEQYRMDFNKYLGIIWSMSTVCHAQAHGQTEHINQVIQADLRSYWTYAQNYLVEKVDMVEFV